MTRKHLEMLCRDMFIKVEDFEKEVDDERISKKLNEFHAQRPKEKYYSEAISSMKMELEKKSR